MRSTEAACAPPKRRRVSLFFPCAASSLRLETGTDGLAISTRSLKTNMPSGVRRSCTVGSPCTMGVANSAPVETVMTRFSSFGRLSTWLAAVIHDPPARFTTPIGFSTIFSSLRILAARRMKVSGTLPAPLPTVSSIGPFGARGSAACAAPRPKAITPAARQAERMRERAARFIVVRMTMILSSVAGAMPRRGKPNPLPSPCPLPTGARVFRCGAATSWRGRSP